MTSRADPAPAPYWPGRLGGGVDHFGVGGQPEVVVRRQAQHPPPVERPPPAPTPTPAPAPAAAAPPPRALAPPRRRTPADRATAGASARPVQRSCSPALRLAGRAVARAAAVASSMAAAVAAPGGRARPRVMARGGMSTTTSPRGRTIDAAGAGGLGDFGADLEVLGERLLGRPVGDQLDADHQAALADLADVGVVGQRGQEAGQRLDLGRQRFQDRLRLRRRRGWPAPRRSTAGSRSRSGRGRASGAPRAGPGRRRTPRSVASVADSGRYPPVRPLARQRMSGSTPSCSQANIFPVRPKPVATSSTISSTPWRRAMSAHAAEMAVGGGDDAGRPLHQRLDHHGRDPVAFPGQHVLEGVGAAQPAVGRRQVEGAAVAVRRRDRGRGEQQRAVRLVEAVDAADRHRPDRVAVVGVLQPHERRAGPRPGGASRSTPS